MANTNNDFSPQDLDDFSLLHLQDYKRRWHKSMGSIEYVRVNEIDDYKPGQLIFGTVILTDSGDADGCEDEVVYHRTSVKPESKGPGEYLCLTGPSRVIQPGDGFHISVNLWVKLCDQITKEIANGEIFWDPWTHRDSVGKPVEEIIRGERGNATVGFSIIKKAFSATINVVMMNELPAQIYGTIKSVRFLGASSSITQVLFDKSGNEWVQVNPQQSLPLTRPAVFPVEVDSYLTIAVDLRNHDNDQIALGSLQFTPSVGTKMMKCGQVHVVITSDASY